MRYGAPGVLAYGLPRMAPSNAALPESHCRRAARTAVRWGPSVSDASLRNPSTASLRWASKVWTALGAWYSYAGSAVAWACRSAASTWLITVEIRLTGTPIERNVFTDELSSAAAVAPTRNNGTSMASSDTRIWRRSEALAQPKGPCPFLIVMPSTDRPPRGRGEHRARRCSSHRSWSGKLSNPRGNGRLCDLGPVPSARCRGWSVDADQPELRRRALRRSVPPGVGAMTSPRGRVRPRGESCPPGDGTSGPVTAQLAGGMPPPARPEPVRRRREAGSLAGPGASRRRRDGRHGAPRRTRRRSAPRRRPRRATRARAYRRRTRR